MEGVSESQVALQQHLYQCMIRNTLP